MSGMAEVLAKHQQDYSLLTVENPHSMCLCGETTSVELPEDWPRISSAESELLRLHPHLTHQEDMLRAAGFGDVAEAKAEALEEVDTYVDEVMFHEDKETNTGPLVAGRGPLICLLNDKARLLRTKEKREKNV